MLYTLLHMLAKEGVIAAAAAAAVVVVVVVVVVAAAAAAVVVVGGGGGGGGGRGGGRGGGGGKRDMPKGRKIEETGTYCKGRELVGLSSNIYATLMFTLVLELSLFTSPTLRDLRESEPKNASIRFSPLTSVLKILRNIK